METKKTKDMELKATKRICEQSWHEEVELKPLEECPICHSEGYHKFVVIR